MHSVSKYGIDDNDVKYFQSDLAERNKKQQLKGHFLSHSPLALLFHVSILISLIFIVYINSLLASIGNDDVLLYADDTELVEYNEPDQRT